MERTNPWSRFFVVLMLMFSVVYGKDRLPYTIVNNSTYPDDQVYVALVGITDGHVWLDGKTGEVKPMSKSDNTLLGPTINGNTGPGQDSRYADCFTKLSELPNRTLEVPQIAGCRMLISFGSPLYLYFFGHSGAPSGYAAANLANPTDPNQGVRFEMIELTWNQYGLWTNTTRVDSYQYAMNLRVTGANGFEKSVGELIPHDSIVARYKTEVGSPFNLCLDEETGVIEAPSKLAAFQQGGEFEQFFDPYVDSIWERYSNEFLTFSSGDAGIWKGKVEGEQFVFHNLTNSFGNATAYITRRPNTQEVLEGKGVLAENVQNLSTQTLDLVVQAQFCAALNRHAIDLSVPEGTIQDWSDESKYFAGGTYNSYVKFWHDRTISRDGKSYGFCYDDVFDKSSTIHAQTPESVTVTIGVKPSEETSVVPSKQKVEEMSLAVQGRTIVLNRNTSVGSKLELFNSRGQRLFSSAITGNSLVIPQISSGMMIWRISESGTVTSGIISKK